jgi:hypothetical protein
MHRHRAEQMNERVESTARVHTQEGALPKEGTGAGHGHASRWGTSVGLPVNALSFNLLIHGLVPLKDSLHSQWMEDVAWQT